MKRLLEGYSQFRRDIFPAQRGFFADLSRGQEPETLFITCADSRVVPNLITQADPGEIFTCRNVGNIVPPHGEFTGGVSSAIEYAVMALRVRNIIVLGHSDCGAMKALLHPEQVASMRTVAGWLQHAQAATQIVAENRNGLEGEELLRAITEENVVVQLDHLRTHPAVASRMRKGQVELHGWVYDIAHGELRAWNPAERRFIALNEQESVAAGDPVVAGVLA